MVVDREPMKEAVIGLASSGVFAPMGDVVIAAAVVTPEVDDHIDIVSDRTAEGVILNINDKKSGKLLVSLTAIPTSRGISVTPVSGSLSAHTLLGETFEMFARVASFSTAIGFCPQSITDLFRRVETSISNLCKVTRKAHPTDRVVDATEKLPESGKEFYWTSYSLSHPNLFIQSSWDAPGIVAACVADVIATGVRTARMYDLSDIYPALKLDSNLGYACRDLYVGLQKFPSLDERGFRGELTESWIHHFEETAPSLKKAREVESTSSDPEPSPGAVSRGPDGKEIMGFNLALATRWANELHEALEKKDPKTLAWGGFMKNFVPSIFNQLQAGRRLTGRQMYVLSDLYGKKGW